MNRKNKLLKSILGSSLLLSIATNSYAQEIFLVEDYEKESRNLSIGYLNPNLQQDYFNYEVPTEKIVKPYTNIQPYVVNHGDNFYNIAQRFNVTVADLAELNSIEDTSLISVNQSILVGSVRHNVNISKSSYGFYGEVLCSNSLAEVGERVTLKVIPDSGYYISELVINDLNGNEVPCGYDWVDDNHAFIMPESKVIVYVTFKEVATDKYMSNSKITGNGTISLSNENPIVSEVVTIRTSPSNGYVTSFVGVVDSTNKDILCVKVSDNVYQYTQPSSNVTIHTVYYDVENTVNNYTDINYEDWYAAYASYAIEKGLMNGTAQGVFDPNIATSRGMVALILANVSGETIETAAKQEFSDVDLGLWYTNAISWCKDRGIVAGYEDGTFQPNAAITREQMVTIIRSFAKYMGYDINVFFPERLSAYVDSTDISSYAIEPFSWALGLNYIQGTGNLITPKNNSTRAEFANILNLFLENNK